MSMTSARRKSTVVSLSLILIVMAAVAVSNESTNNGGTDDLPEKEYYQVVSVESYDTGGNMGYGEIIEVHISNGTQLNYQKYTNNDPLCYGMPENQINESRCEDYGETSKEEGFDQARKLVNDIGEDRKPENLCFYPETVDLFRNC